MIRTAPKPGIDQLPECLGGLRYGLRLGVVVAVLYVGLAVVVLQSITPQNLAAHADTAVAEAARRCLGIPVTLSSQLRHC